VNKWASFDVDVDDEFHSRRNCSMIRPLSIITLAAAALGGLTLMSIAPTVALAQQTPTQNPTPAAAGNHVEGTVASLTATGFTITTRYGNQTVTVTTTPQTRYRVTNTVALTSLQTGTPVIIGGEVDSTGDTITARGINVLQKLPEARPNATAPAAQHGIVGTIATITPSLTVTGIDGKTYTVTTTPRTMVRQVEPGTSTSVTTGAFVRVTGEDASTAGTTGTVTARGVDILPVPTAGGGQGFAGRHHRNNQDATPAATGAPAI
jgi:hypothetical protein